MSNPFSDEHMAAGYAAARPPVHPRVLALLRDWLGGRHHRVALDLGCGAGLSTRPLREMAATCVGFDPAEAMVRTARTLRPDLPFVAAGAEAMPFATASVDLVAAAGSLNYTRDLAAVWPEVRRVLTADGCLAVYDFATARSFADGDTLDAWFQAFTTRYPYPAGQAIPLSPAILAERASGFRVERGEDFAIPITLTPEFFVDYMLTETCVQDAVRRGTPLESVRQWCEATVPDVFDRRPRPVLFRGYLATLTAH
jgi:SAM-dependent methyltransferase